MSENITRLAPSATGALHLGNARSFLINWAMARQRGWKIVLRIEDLDGPRVKRGAARQAIDDLRWLGIDWDRGPTYQLPDLSRYHAALGALAKRGLIYPCRCGRGEIVAAQSAPHDDEHELRYPGKCRPATGVGATATCWAYDASADRAWRVIVPDEVIVFEDALHERVATNVQRNVGDFVVATRRGLPAYQLAVVIDDAAAGVTQVVRGEDLLRSTARQLLLYRLLEAGPVPRYCHLPLVIGEDGRRLAKRHGDTRLSFYRRLGVPAERIIGLLARWSMPVEDREGSEGDREFGELVECRGRKLRGRRAMSAAAFVERFDLMKLPRQPTVFTAADDRWLREGATR